MVGKRTWKRGWIALLLAAVLVGPVSAGSRLLGANVRVTDDGLGKYADASEPDVAVHGGTVYAVWRDNRNTLDSVETDIYFARSTDGGASWSSNVLVNDPDWRGNGLDYPAIAVGPEGNIYVAWYLGYCSDCGGAGKENDVHLARSTDGGDTFDFIWLWDGGASSIYDIVPPLAVDQSNGKLYVLLDAPVSSQTADVYLMGCDAPDVANWDDSAWWSVRVNDASGSGRIYDLDDGPLMALAARDGVVCAAWEDSRGSNAIYGACSTDGGKHFGANFAISGAEATNPHLAFGPNGVLYAAYQVHEDSSDNIYIRHSDDHGTTWSDAVLVPTGGTATWGWDMAVDDNGTVAVVWVQGSYSASDLYLSTSIDGGRTFSTVQVDDADTIYTQRDPALAVSGSSDDARAYLVWGDDRDNSQDQIWSARAELDATPPTAPPGLWATPGDTVVTLGWSPATDRNGIQSYNVLRAAQSGGPYTVINPLPVTGTSYRDVGLDGTTYYYKVYAVDGTGNVGPASGEISAAATVGTDMPTHGTLAYEVGGDIRVNDLPGLGNERTLAQGLAPHLAPDGSRVYYYGDHAILSRPVSGGDAQTHYADGDLTAHFDLPADASYFARIEQQFYAGINPGQSCYAWEPHYGPFEGDDLYVATNALASGVALSPDRRWLAYTTVGVCGPAATAEYSKMNLCLVNLGTGGKSCHNNVNYQDPDFAPSGDWLVFAADFSGQYEIWKARVQDDGSLTDLTQLTRSNDGEWSLHPAWSSDGNWVAFARGTPAGDDVRLPGLQAPRMYVVRADGAFLRPTNLSGEAPAWYGGGPAAMDYALYLPLVVRR